MTPLTAVRPTGARELRVQETPRARLAYVDDLRWFMIFLVVLMHLKVTYGDMGLWYYVEPARLKPLAGLVFGVYGSFVQAFCMGLLFFLAGTFVPGSCDRKGVGGFVRERLVRLGIPTLVYMLLLHPVTVLVVAAFQGTLPPGLLSWYGRYLSSLAFLSNAGPLWFTLALLVFSMVYALVRRVFPALEVAGRGQAVAPTHGRILALIGLISAAAFLLRLVQPAPGAAGLLRGQPRTENGTAGPEGVHLNKPDRAVRGDREPDAILERYRAGCHSGIAGVSRSDSRPLLLHPSLSNHVHGAAVSAGASARISRQPSNADADENGSGALACDGFPMRAMWLRWLSST